MAEEFSIEQDYGRAIPPIIQKETEKAHEEQELDFADIEETDDGGAIVTLPEEEEIVSDFYDNLAETMEPSAMRSMALDLLEIIEKDKEARSKRDEQYEEGIRRTGMGKDAPGGAAFTGASRVVHPIMAEACVDFASRAIKELFPPSGPVRTKIIGTSTREKLAKADRKREYMNWQLTCQIKNYRSELEQLLTQLPLGGGQYLKFWYDDRLKRPDCEFVPIDQVYLPYSCTNFYSSPRVTHAQDITKFEFQKRVRTGLYRDVSVIDSTLAPEASRSKTANDKVEGAEESGYNEDGLRRVYEIYVTTEISHDDITNGDTAPYIITIDEYDKSILAIYRNWEENDITFEKLDWIVEFPFIPWRGAYPIGLPQLIGGLSAALTGALRALLDTAHINNSPSLLKLKSAGRGNLNGQSKSVDPTELTEVEGPAGVDDVRKLVMPMPFNPPSTVLFQLLDWLTAQAKGVVSTASEKIADATNSMPVGTALALIEQGSITYSAIHSRLHHAQAKALEIISRLNRQYLDDEQIVADLGGVIISRKDFEGSLDIIPVSDPNIFSEAQRYAQVQAILQLETVSQPNTFNQYAVRRRALSLMHVDDIDEILPPPPTPKEINAVAENVAVTYAQPLAAFPEQDHLAHIETHLNFITDANAGGNPLFSSALIPMMDHVKQHIIMFYANCVDNAIEQGGGLPEKIEDQDSAVAVANILAQEAMESMFAQFKEPFAKAMQAVQQAQQAQQEAIQDPSAKAMLQAALAETKRKADADKVKAQQDAQKLNAESSLEASRQQSETSLRMQKQQSENAAKEADLQKQMAELQLRQQQAQAQSATQEQQLALKSREQELKHELALAEIERKQLEFQRMVWEFAQKQGLEHRKLDIQENQNETEVIREALNQKREDSQREQEQARQQQETEAVQQTEKDSDIKALLSTLVEHLSKPKNLTVVRDKRGKAIRFTTEG